ncbi:TraR/DksA C4-type zinc finger protein [candidate division KSB1 bacterium]|nr:TraR/DksA C4-type zinc finger protein [candidate division KSB1 bacterium]
MECKKLEGYKHILEKMREQILDDLKAEKRKESLRETSGEHSYSYHMADEGSACNENEKSYIIASMEGNTLEDLDEALNRIDDGSYGKCVLCEKDINSKRLDALPYANLCIECKSEQEKEKY